MVHTKGDGLDRARCRGNISRNFPPTTRENSTHLAPKYGRVNFEDVLERGGFAADTTVTLVEDDLEEVVRERAYNL